MSDFAEISRQMLPGPSGKWEKVTLAAMLAAWGLDVDSIERESNPDTCNVAYLPFLAFDYGIRTWNDNWSEERKRWVVRNAFTIKRMHGTPQGVEVAVNLADGLLIEERYPPGDSFAIDDSGIDYEAMVALMPQLRLYHSWPNTEMPHYTFAGVDAAGDFTASFIDRATTLPRYPVLWDNGVETPLRVGQYRQEDGIGYLTFVGEAGHATFAGSDFAGDFAVDPFVPEPIVFNLSGGLAFFANTPDAHRNTAFARSNHAGMDFAEYDFGLDYGYDRLVLWDSSRLPAGKSSKDSAAAFAGISWLGMSPYEIILSIKFPGYPELMSSNDDFAGVGFAFNYDDTKEDFLLRSISRARRVGDRALVEFVESPGGYATHLPILD